MKIEDVGKIFDYDSKDYVETDYEIKNRIAKGLSLRQREFNSRWGDNEI